MPAIQALTYKSPPQTHVASSVMRFPPWVPQFGPSGGRNVIDMLELVYNFTDITCATTATEGEDFWRAIESLVVEQVDGVQRYQGIQGDALRIFLYQALGADRVPEYADLAVAANQSLVVAFPIPLAKRYSKRPHDFSLPAELLKEIRVGCASNGATGLAIGGGTVTINAANAYVLAHCHEEFSVELKSVDQVAVTSFPSTAGVTLKIGGRMQDLIIFARGAAGGASATGLTELRIDGILPDPLLRNPDLIQSYLRSHSAALNDANAADGTAVHNDPVGQGKAIPVLFTTDDTSVFDGPIVDDVILRVTGGSLASALAITRTVLPQNSQLISAVAKKHGLTDADFRMKTVGKSKRDPAKWDPEKAVFAPKSAALKKRGLAQ